MPPRAPGHPRRRSFGWLLLAVGFLGLSWFWDLLHALVQRFIDLLPLEQAKQAVGRFMARLPPYPTLIVFLIPLALSEPIKIAALWLIAKRHWTLGALVYGGAELIRFGLVAYLFSTCRDKLLSIRWFARLYGLFVRAHDWAHEQVEPVRAWAREAIDYAGLPRGRGDFWRKVGALWRHARRRPPIAGPIG